MRTKKVLKNLATGFFNRTVVEIIKFVVRTIFIYRLSEAYLGATSLFTNILAVLNIAELGIGGSISVALYKPLAEKDNDQVKALMQLYKKLYRIIGLSILLIGTVLSLFIPYLVKERIEGLNLYVVYFLYLIRTVVSYLFFAYKSTLLTADQKNYTVTLVSTCFNVLIAIGQIIVLYSTVSSQAWTFYCYLVVDIVGNIGMNLFIAQVVDKQYPYLKEKALVPIEAPVRAKIFKNVWALFIARISSTALQSTDAIIVSAALTNGLSINGKYANYTMIIAGVTGVFVMISQAITATVGNYVVKESVQKSEQLFDFISLTFTWAYGFCFICLLCLLNPFIGKIWLSENWMLSNRLVFLLALNFLLNGMGFAPVKFIQAAGLYWNARYRYVVSAVLNIFLSYLFGIVLQWGLEGIVFATTISLIGMTCMDPHVVYKYLFHKRAVSYYVRYIILLFAIVTTGLLTDFVCHQIIGLPAVHTFFLNALICLLLPNSIWLLASFKIPLFRNTGKMLLQYVANVTKKQEHK